jgi:hypothetical protein
MATVQPNDTGCDGWQAADSDRPPDTHQADTESALSSAQKDDVSTDDSTPITYGSSPNESASHRFLFDLGTSAVDSATVTVRGYGEVTGPTYGYYLYLWDDGASSWGSAEDSHTTSSKDTVTATATAWIYTSGGHYYLDVRVCAPDDTSGTGSSTIYSYYAECTYTTTSGTTRSHVVIG